MKKPDELVVEIEKSIMPKAMTISLIGHLVLMVVTSIGLFCDWGTYGFHSPSYINAEKARLARAEEDAKRKEAAAEKAKKEAAAAEAKKQAAATNVAAKASAPAKGTEATAAKPTVATEGASVKIPPEVEPLPPKAEFKYGEDLSLD